MIRTPFYKRSRHVHKAATSALRFVHQCAWCRQPGTWELGPDGKPWHMDHVIPLARGGADHPSNIVKACAQCNLVKGSANRTVPNGTPLGDGTIAGEHKCLGRTAWYVCNDCEDIECEIIADEWGYRAEVPTGPAGERAFMREFGS